MFHKHTEVRDPKPAWTNKNPTYRIGNGCTNADNRLR